MTRYHAVIARYKEDISWLEDLRGLLDITVYDKGDKLAPNHIPNIPHFNCSQFEGAYHAKTPTGRESHTYLYHILKCYPNFADITLFCQGKIDDHAHQLQATLKHLILTRQQPRFLHFGNVELNDKRGACRHHGLPIERIFCRLFDTPMPQHLIFHLSACFLVSRESILFRPKSFYEQMMQIIYEEPLSGYVFERLWEFVFNAPHLPSHAKYPPHHPIQWQLEGL